MEIKDTTIVMYVGKFLQENEFVSANDIQKEISLDQWGEGGYMVEMRKINSVFIVLLMAGFIEEITDGIYTLKNKTIVHETVIKNVVPFADVRVGMED